MMWNEIKKYATSNGLKVKKVDDTYVWDEKIYSSLNELTKDLFNHVTNNKYIENQKSYNK